MNNLKCWCGMESFKPFSESYVECEKCKTLVSTEGLNQEELVVKDDETDFYGKKYWLGHQVDDLGYPDIYKRARNDLAERNLYWLKVLMKYKLPSAKILELGSANGSFVYLLNKFGYEASGLEMSPWVVDFSKKLFDIPVYLGPLESTEIPDASLDVIAMMDVLEHLSNPIHTIGECFKKLKPNGFLLIQTPKYVPGKVFKGMIETQDPFLTQLKSDEHLFLFSEESIHLFFKSLGFNNITFEKAIFDQYDMFFVVPKNSLNTFSTESIEQNLLQTSTGRISIALLDLYDQTINLSKSLNESEIDRSARAEQITTLIHLLKESELDRYARAEQITTLTQLLKESELDRYARAEQITTLTQLLKESELDRYARAEQITTLTQLLKESELDRLASFEQIQILTKMIQTKSGPK